MEETEKRLLEIRLKSAELELERRQRPADDQAPRGLNWDSPLVLAIAGAVGTALLAIINNAWQYHSTKEVEKSNLESSLILKAIESPSAGERKKALVFLLDAGLIEDAAGKIRNIPEDSVPRVRATGLPAPSESKPKYLNLIPIPESINPKLSPAQQSTLMKVFGAPGALTNEAGAATNEKLQRLLVSADVGPFKVTGLAPAVEVVQRVMLRVKAEMPDLYAQLRSQGMLAVRSVRGSGLTFSNHSWGTAIDISISGEDDISGDQRCLQGLALLAPLFNDEGFYWGAGFSREDSSHFEASEELLQEWVTKGKL